MMPRMSRRVDDVQKEFAEDFTVVNGNLLLCKFCDSIVKWQKKTRIIEHLNTKMHAERKELKMQRFLAEMQSQAGNDDDDFDQDDEVASAHDSIWEQEEPRGIDPNEAQYCLKWNNHQSNMIEVFNRLFGDEQFTDVLIAADGRKIRAHKIVLSACSSYFENLFMTFDEKNQIVILKDANYIDVFAIIEFIYKGEVNVGQDQLPSLLQTAENLKVKGLSETSSSVQGHSPGDTSKYRTIPSYGNANYRRSICNTHTPVKTISAQFSSIPASNSSFVTASMTSGQNANERGNKRSSFDAKRDIVNENSIRQIYSQKIPNSILRTSSPTSNVRPIVASSITSSQNSGGTVTVSPTINSLKHFRDLSPVSSISIGGDQIKRKRGRPRILDSDTDLFEQLHDTEEQDRQDINIMQGNGSCDATFGSGIIESPLKIKSSNKMPTPGGPLTEERIKELGVIKMNDYLSNGTRPQFWEEYFVKVIMHAVKNKEVDVKGAAELLGVSYGTLYGRYRELFGYVKHAWNLAGRPMKLIPMPKNFGLSPGGFTKEPSAATWTDPTNQDVLDKLKNGQVTIRQAAELLGIAPAVLAYQLSGKVSCDGSPAKLSNFPTDGNFFTGNIDFETGMMAVPLDLDMEDGDASYDDNMTDAQMDVSGGATGMSENENSKSSIRITNLQSGSTLNKNLYKQKVEEDEDGVPAPITIAKQSKDVAKKVFC